MAAAGKCPTSLPPPKLNQKRATPEVEKRKPSRPDALAAAGRCPTALPPPRASTNPATSPISPSKPKRAEPDDADATDGERTASPADLNPDLGGGFVASARAPRWCASSATTPEKVDEVDTLLTKWPGREAQLLSAVEAKYSREEAAPASPAAVPKPADVLAAVMGDAGRTKSPTPERMRREIVFTRDRTPRPAITTNHHLHGSYSRRTHSLLGLGNRIHHRRADGDGRARGLVHVHGLARGRPPSRGE